MRSRIAIFGSLTALLSSGMVWWWIDATAPRPAQSPPASRSSPLETPPASSLPVLRSIAQPATGTFPWQGNTYAPLPADRAPGFDPTLPQWNEWRRRKAEDPHFEWKMPIRFYGKVVDQDGRPVQEAKVRFQWTDTSAHGTTEKFVESDAAGMFSLTDVTGKRLCVFVAKEGYHALDRGRGSFEYAAFFEPIYIEPDPDQPVVFKLLKKRVAEPLIVGDVYCQLSYDRGPYYYDLEQCRITRQPPATGLKFTFDRAASAQGQPFDWAWTVEGVKAGVRLTDDEFPQLAPEGGYTGQWQTAQSATAERFQQCAQARLYVQTADGRYAVVDLELSQPNRWDMGPSVGVKSSLNPSGSRNLEFDPGKVVKDYRR